MKRPLRTLIFSMLFIILTVIITVIGFTIDALEVRDVYLEGVQALADGELDDAENSFKTIIATYEFYQDEFDEDEELLRYLVKAYYFLGDVYFMNRDYEDSIESYRKVVQKYTDNEIYPRCLYKLGRSLVLNEDYGSGIAILFDYIGKYDDNDDLADNSLYWIARAYGKQGNYALAIQNYELILTAYPDTALKYEVRSSLTEMETLLAAEQSKETGDISAYTNELAQLKQENKNLMAEKDLLERISEVLLIKQRLLELKADKIELLTEIRLEREVGD